ncbi:MAG: choline kinase family protein [Acidimicrobiales bacterium]|jgi:thiamine kinase-like enzyme
MTTPVDQLVGRLWPGRTVRVERLSGGMTNANYLADFDDEQVVVRIPGKDTALLGIDRRHEAEANRLAASIGVAPQVLLESQLEGYLVTRFLPARAVPPAELAAEPMLGEVAATLRLVHGAGTVAAHFNPFDVVAQYHEIAEGHGVTEPFDYAGARDVLGMIATVRPFRPAAFCHNDLLNENFLYDERIRLLDWEYSGMGDPFFDLANFSINHELSAHSDDLLLEHYFGHVDEGQRSLLALMRLVSEMREAMWGVVQLAISEIDMDFDAYCQRRAQRFATLLAEMDITDALARAGTVEGARD